MESRCGRSRLSHRSLLLELASSLRKRRSSQEYTARSSISDAQRKCDPDSALERVSGDVSVRPHALKAGWRVRTCCSEEDRSSAKAIARGITPPISARSGSAPGQIQPQSSQTQRSNCGVGSKWPSRVSGGGSTHTDARSFPTVRGAGGSGRGRSATTLGTVSRRRPLSAHRPIEQGVAGWALLCAVMI
jgi:hypothetical protein